MKFIKKNFSLSIFIFLFAFLFNFSSQHTRISLKFPNSLVLLDSSLAIVSNNGIHFYDNEFLIEESTKSIPFNVEENNLESLFMAQFSSEDDGYIIIFINKIIYIFDAQKNLLTSKNLNETISGSHYCIVPYKKDNNVLKFIISYADADSKKIILEICQFDLSNNNILITKKSYQALTENGGNAGKLEGVYCLLMKPLPSFDIENDLLTCFGGVEWEPRIFSTTFNPEDDFKEMDLLRAYKSSSFLGYNIRYITAKTNENKNKALIFTVHAELLLWTTFDYIKEIIKD